MDEINVELGDWSEMGKKNKQTGMF